MTFPLPKLPDSFHWICRTVSSSHPPVLVFGEGLTVLGTIRSLAREGIPALVVTEDVGFARGSRFFRTGPRITMPSLQDYLGSLPYETAVLFPCTDHWAREVAGLPEGLRERFPAPIPSWEVVETFLDKGRFSRFLQAHGIPQPRSVSVNDSFDLEGIGETQGLFIKPLDSQRFNQRYRVKAFDTGSVQDLKEKLLRLAEDDVEVLLQEYIPGPPSNHYFVDGYYRDRETRGLVLRQRLRMYPSRFGNSTYMRTVPVANAQGAVAVVEDALRAADYSGIFSAELKLDARDGTFKVLEINARPWWFIEFAAQSGVNVAALAYGDLVGAPREGLRIAIPGRECIYPYLDFRACMETGFRKPATFGAWVMASVTGYRPLFQWGDPIPALLSAGELVRKLVEGPRALRD